MRPLLGVDSMLFAYHFEDNEEFGSAAGRLLAAAEAGRCHLVASVLARMEVLVFPKKHRRDDLWRRYCDFFDSFPNLTLRPIGLEIADLAAEVRASQPIRTPDALHLATAMHSGATAFVSEDRRLRSFVGVKVLGLEEALKPLAQA